MTHERSFKRRIDALESIFAFTAEVLVDTDAGLASTIDFVLEELFTNVVKYGVGQAPVVIRIDAIEGGVEVTLDEPEARAFDVTRGPEVDVTAPIEAREPGGLGLHLIPKLVDSVTYTYDAASRLSRTTFRMIRRTPAAGASG